MTDIEVIQSVQCLFSTLFSNDYSTFIQTDRENESNSDGQNINVVYPGTIFVLLRIWRGNNQAKFTPMQGYFSKVKITFILKTILFPGLEL